LYNFAKTGVNPLQGGHQCAEKYIPTTSLSEKYTVEGIPTLVLVNGSGKLISTEGRERVTRLGINGFPWGDDKLAEAEKANNEKIEKLPKKVKVPDHEHELELRKSVYEGMYGCNGCGELGTGWAYHCDECQYDLHPIDCVPK